MEVCCCEREQVLFSFFFFLSPLLGDSTDMNLGPSMGYGVPIGLRHTWGAFLAWRVETNWR